jgi:hypothetical protein
MILVDEWRIWIPHDKAKLYTASKIIWWISFWVGMLEIEGDVIDIIAIGEEEDAPMTLATNIHDSLTETCPTMGDHLLQK